MTAGVTYLQIVVAIVMGEPATDGLHRSDQQIAGKFGKVSDDHKADDEQHPG